MEVKYGYPQELTNHTLQIEILILISQSLVFVFVVFFLSKEAQLSEIILGTNETSLSGDLQGNDVNTINLASNYGNTTRNTDNSYRIICYTNRRKFTVRWFNYK